MKSRWNRANKYIVIGINRLSHIQWPIFEDENEDIIKKGDVNFHTKSCCYEKSARKRNWEQTPAYNISSPRPIIFFHGPNIFSYPTIKHSVTHVSH